MHRAVMVMVLSGYAFSGIAREQLCVRERAKIDDLIANRHAAAIAFRRLRVPENPEGKILQREGAAAHVRGCQPAASLGIVRHVQRREGHGLAGSKRFFSPSQWLK